MSSSDSKNSSGAFRLSMLLLGCIFAVICGVCSLGFFTDQSRPAVIETEQAEASAPAPEVPVATVEPVPVESPEPAYPTTLAYAATDKHPGSTLWGIAVRECGNGYRWTDILELNNLERPEDLQPGEVKLPMDCTLKGKPIKLAPVPEAAPDLLVAQPSPDPKIGPKAAPVVLEPPPDLPDDIPDDQVIIFDCTQPRPMDATSSGRYFNQWLQQCGESFFGDMLYGDDFITTPQVAEYQLEQASSLVTHMNFLYSLVIKNPKRFRSEITNLRTYYWDSCAGAGMRNFNRLSYVDAAQLLDEVKIYLAYYDNEWVSARRREGAFSPLIRFVFPYVKEYDPPQRLEDAGEWSTVAVDCNRQGVPPAPEMTQR